MLLTVVIASFYDTARFNNNNDITLYKLNRCIVLSIMLRTRLYLQIHRHIGPSYIFLAKSQYCQFRKQEWESRVNTTLWRSQNRRLAAYFICIFIASGRICCDPSFCWLMCLFVGRLAGWFVRSLTSCQRLQWLARAPFLVAHTSCINRLIANLL